MGVSDVLVAHWEAVGETQHRGRDSVQARAAHCVSRAPGGRQSAGAEYSAGRRDLRVVWSKEAGNGNGHRKRGYEFQLSRGVWRWGAKRVCDVAGRLRAGRCDAI